MDKIWYGNPLKSEVIGRCGGDEKTEWPRRTDKSRTLKNTQKKNKTPFSNLTKPWRLICDLDLEECLVKYYRCNLCLVYFQGLQTVWKVQRKEKEDQVVESKCDIRVYRRIWYFCEHCGGVGVYLGGGGGFP